MSTAVLHAVDRAAFVRSAVIAADAARHCWPGYAACEAAIDSDFGTSELAENANNFFKLRAPVKLQLPDRIYPMRGVLRQLDFLKFQSMAECFEYRMLFLRRFPVFAPALRARTGREYIQAVSLLWSGDRARAQQVLDLYRAVEGQ